VTRPRVVMTLVVCLVCLFSAGRTSAQNSTAANISGDWSCEVKVGKTTGTPTISFNQVGEKVSGHYSSTMFGEVDFVGVVKGDKVKFSLKVQAVSGDGQTTMSFDGTINSRDAISGSVEIGPNGRGTFKAIRSRPGVEK
jgi:hypothetical protein